MDISMQIVPPYALTSASHATTVLEPHFSLAPPLLPHLPHFNRRRAEGHASALFSPRGRACPHVFTLSHPHLSDLSLPHFPHFNSRRVGRHASALVAPRLPAPRPLHTFPTPVPHLRLHTCHDKHRRRVPGHDIHHVRLPLHLCMADM